MPLPLEAEPEVHQTRSGVRMIALDLDGTLIDSEGKISVRSRKALRRAIAEGIQIVIATGRRHSYAMRVLAPLDLGPSLTLLSSNGSVIRTAGAELLHRDVLPQADALWLCDHLRDYREGLVLTFDLVDERGRDTNGSLVVERIDFLHSSIKAWIDSNAKFIRIVNPIDTALQEGRHAIQAMICGTVQRMEEAEAHLMQHPSVYAADEAETSVPAGARVAIHRTSYPDRDLCIVDLLPAGCSKGAALRRLCKMQSMPCESVMAMGDNWNDVPLFQAAGRSVLMGNASSELKALAAERGWQLGRSHDEDGVAIAIEALLDT